MFYEKLDEETLERIKKMQNITMTNYEICGSFIPIDSWKYIAEDLMYEVEHLEEKIEDILQDREDNYRQIEPKEMYGDVEDNKWLTY